MGRKSDRAENYFLVSLCRARREEFDRSPSRGNRSIWMHPSNTSSPLLLFGGVLWTVNLNLR